MKRVIPAIAKVLLISGLLLMLLPAQIASAATPITVDDDGPADYTTIQAAVSAANPGDTVYVHSGTYSGNIFLNKPVNIEGEDKANTIIDGDGSQYGIYIQGGPVGLAYGVEITNLTVQNCIWGITIYNSTSNSITNNNVVNNNATGSHPNGCGIILSQSDSNTVENNDCSNNRNGIYLDNNCDYNTVSNNIASNNEQSGILVMWNSHENTVSGNDIHGNKVHGISLYAGCDGNLIENNTIANNTMHGISLLGTGSDNNIVKGNTITENVDHGIIISNNCNGNEVYNNKFIDNGTQAAIVMYSEAIFNHPKPIGGNYWSDWTSPDSDFDGFVDTPYYVGSDISHLPPHVTQDNLPWAIQDGWLSPAAEVQGYKWEDLNGNGKWDQDEPAMSGITIYVDLSQDDVLDEGEPSTVTDENGWYSIAGLPTGVGLRISEIVPDDYEQTFPAVPGFWDLNLSPGQVLTDINFGNRMAEIIIQIDIKPGSDPNSINLNSKGVIPVAILTEESFDAASVDATTVRFGRTGYEAEPDHYSFEDVDDDGDVDMILHFRTQDTGMEPDDTEAILTGLTTNGIEITGTDSVRIVPPEDKGQNNSNGNGNGNLNPGQGDNQGGGNDNPNSGQGNNQGDGNGNSNSGQGNGKGKGKK
ncbi:NosD domain-containing protein [Chloroflexota bacterium]